MATLIIQKKILASKKMQKVPNDEGSDTTKMTKGKMLGIKKNCYKCTKINTYNRYE